MRGSYSQPGRVIAAIRLLTLGLAVVAVLALAFTPGLSVQLRDGGVLAPLLIFVAYVLTETYSFNLEYRRQAISFSLSEAPTAFALIFLDPATAVTLRVCSCVIAKLLLRRVDRLKLPFNTAMVAAEVAVAALLLRTLLDVIPTGSDTVFILLVPSVLVVVSALSFLVLSVVIFLTESTSVRALLVGFEEGAPIWVLGALAGATSLSPALIHPALFLVPVLPCVLVWRSLSTRGLLAQKHRDLTELHMFTRAVSTSLQLRDVTNSAQVEGRRLLRAGGAALLAFDEKGTVLEFSTTVGGNDALPRNAADERWSAVLRSEGAVRLFARDATLPGSLLTELGWEEALAIAIRDPQGVVGFFAVADRVGGLNKFSTDDLIRMGPLADQLAASLRKSILHVRMERDATHDRLTGLPCRALFEDLLAKSLADNDRTAVFLLDLDRFKEVNDGLGHHVGDLLLQAFAKRVTSILGPDDVLARLAGDEFAVLSRGASDQYAMRIGMEIVERGRHTFDIGELSVAVSCSIGLAIGPADGRDPEELLQRADLAMYRAKSRSSGLEIYTADLDSGSADRLELLRDLREVINSGDLDVYFQPKVNLTTGQVVGAEALVRWHHPRRGLLEADTFIKLMEQTDLIHSMTDHVLAESLKAAREWRAKGWQIDVSVNVSPRTLLDELLADRVARHLAQHGLEPGILTVEITETSVMADVSRALGTLNRLDDLGVKLSVDDFGTGYSSLAYLRRLPVSEIKIDRAFVMGMLKDKHDHIIVKSTIELGRHLGLTVVAEGIENDLVARRLRDLGCDLGQGRGYAPPLPLPEFNLWVLRHGKQVTSAETKDRKRWESA